MLTDLLPAALRRHPVGREILTAAEKERQVAEERRAARARLLQAEVDREGLSALADAVAKAETKYHAEMDRLAGKLHDARVAHDSLAASTARAYDRAESTLRRTAPAMVSESGDVVWSVIRAIEHLRARHFLRSGDDERLTRWLAASTPETPAREDTEPIERAKERIKEADRAAELVDALDFALAELRDCQLEAEVDPATVREIIDDCPAACTCGHPFGIRAAFDKATESEGA
jgi:hypothetical protein